ncbi:flavin monoamine oxidase family protein [Streptomyces sp. NPDC058052]|uniref:flavin monoamine oxidase family protein n=1 Tax=Streptomyces sp. NPDC058052 TaxID=3346316 RepID=UPI0036E19D6A
MSDVDVDVVVVGAGYAGLIAARALLNSGLTVQVLEAADRVGGRAMTVSSAAGTAVDLGGQWIGRDHVKMRALADEYGVSLFPTHTDGKTLIRYRGRDVSLLSATGVAVGAAFIRLAAAERFGLGARDDQTLAMWLAKVGPRRARRLLEVTLGEVTATDPESVSVRAVAEGIRGAGGLREMFGVEGGAQDALLTGGAGGLAESIAIDLGAAIQLNQPVTGIARDGGGVTVSTPYGATRARRVVVTTAPPVAKAIAHRPALPEARELVQRDTFMGTVYKAVVVYDSPFWRADGYSGELFALDGPVPSAFDVSPPGGRGHLCVLVPGQGARDLDGLSEDVRRSAILAELARHFGELARHPLSFHEKSWHRDEFVQGGYMAWPRPGSLEGVRTAGAEPVGRVHWAGTETSSRYGGYFEGAVLSGERVADEVLAAL